MNDNKRSKAGELDGIVKLIGEQNSWIVALTEHVALLQFGLNDLRERHDVLQAQIERLEAAFRTGCHNRH